MKKLLTLALLAATLLTSCAPRPLPYKRTVGQLGAAEPQPKTRRTADVH